MVEAEGEEVVVEVEVEEVCLTLTISYQFQSQCALYLAAYAAANQSKEEANIENDILQECTVMQVNISLKDSFKLSKEFGKMYNPVDINLCTNNRQMKGRSKLLLSKRKQCNPLLKI